LVHPTKAAPEVSHPIPAACAARPFRHRRSLDRFDNGLFTDHVTDPQEEKDKTMTLFSGRMIVHQNLASGAIFTTSQGRFRCRSTGCTP
jgi:hypothetical protein